EIDHPATQARKRRLVEPGTAGVAPACSASEKERAGRPRSQVAGDAATFLARDFEHDPVGQLPQRLSELGYRCEERGCVVWEGVTMYLTEAANAAMFAMLADLLAADSIVVFTYFSRELLHAPALGERLIRQFVASRGEPWVFGWEPDLLPA